MDMNSVSTRSRNDRAVPSISQRIAQRLHILLVVHNVASLMFLASRFEKQQYQGDGLMCVFLFFKKFGILSNGFFQITLSHFTSL